MNREEILQQARKQNKGLDERMVVFYHLAYVVAVGLGIIMCALFTINEVLKGGNWFGYVTITMTLLGSAGLIFGISTIKTGLGKLYLAAGIICILSGIFNLVLYFVRG